MPYIGIFLQSFASQLGKETGLALARKLFGTEDRSGVIVEAIIDEMRVLFEDYARRTRQEIQQAWLDDAIAHFRALHNRIVQYEIEGQSDCARLTGIADYAELVISKLQGLNLPAINHYALAVTLLITVQEERARVCSNRRILLAAANSAKQAIDYVQAMRDQRIRWSDGRFSEIWKAAYPNRPGELDIVEYSYAFEGEKFSLLLEGDAHRPILEQRRDQHMEVERNNALDSIAPALDAAVHWQRWIDSTGVANSPAPRPVLEEPA